MLGMTNKTLAKVIVYTKDEYDQIEPFIVFWGTMFGYDNVIVIDNGSTDPRVLSVYEKYKPLGIHVKVDTRHHRNVTTNMTDNIREWRGTCEWMFLLETDEFLFWVPTKEVSSATIPVDKVVNYLASQPDNVSILRYGSFFKCCVNIDDADYRDHMYSCPPRQIVKFADQNWDKIIVRMDRFDKMTQWPHHASATHGNRIVAKDLGLLHFHETGAKRHWERNLMTMNGYKYFDTTMHVQEQIAYAKHFIRIKMEGYHRIEFYLEFLLREFALDQFEIILGRLPSVQEMLEVVSYANTDHMIEHILLNKHRYPQELSVHEKKTREQLFYYAETQPYTWKIYQVKNYLEDAYLRAQIAVDGLHDVLVNSGSELLDVPLDFFTNNQVQDGEGQIDGDNSNPLVLGSQMV